MDATDKDLLLVLSALVCGSCFFLWFLPAAVVQYRLEVGKPVNEHLPLFLGYHAQTTLIIGLPVALGYMAGKRFAIWRKGRR
jgi:hypothetical protein